MVYELQPNGNYRATSPRGSSIILYRVKEYLNDEPIITDDWKWCIMTDHGKDFADCSSYSYEDAAEDAADFILNKYNKEIEYEFE